VGKAWQRRPLELPLMTGQAARRLSGRTRALHRFLFTLSNQQGTSLGSIVVLRTLPFAVAPPDLSC